jgi:hypothetical protein
MRRCNARLPLNDTRTSRAETLEPALGLVRHQHDALRGILLMCAGVSMFPFMNAAVKLLGAPLRTGPLRERNRLFLL